MFKLYTDASDVGLEAVLMQEDDQGKDWVICYKAKTLLPAEKNYLTTEKECLAVLTSIPFSIDFSIESVVNHVILLY